MAGNEIIRGAARATIPRATYRVQLNAAFTFRQATRIIPYLAALGISHVYCSPYFRARPGSAHGYDVVDHNSFNPEIGTPEDFEDFVATLRLHGMGHLLDIVPNHVGIMGADNTWWMDVLENGRASVYAEFFDIDWTPAPASLANKVLVPVLSERYGAVLERGELQLRFEAQCGSFAIVYHEHRLPLDPRTYATILRRALEAVHEHRLEDLIARFAALPDREKPTHSQIEERHREKEHCKTALAELARLEPAVRAAIDAAVAQWSGEPGNPASFDALHALIEAQAYRLASWRVASDEINYRRFFDVNDLAALRMENTAVFEDTHRLTLSLLSAGKLDGLRIDHPDGLFDPEQYFHRLQSRAASMRRRGPVLVSQAGVATLEPTGLPLYLVVEKITASFERLPSTWPVHGTTGYNFANVVNGLFIDTAAKGRIDRIYRAFIGEPAEWREIAYDAKRLILDTSLSSELSVLTNQLARIARSNRHTRDFTFRSLRQALTDIIACFPVYRTYVADSVSGEDRRFIDWAVASAKSRGSGLDTALYEFVRSLLLLEAPVRDETAGQRVRAFARKFQQLTAPVTAKGVEDTALYRFHRLVSLNEVGGEPENFGISVRGFHADAKFRRKHWPHEMLATSTHDTKRSEDTRTRIDVLSEMPSQWRRMLARWRRMNRLRKREIDGRAAPGPNQEYLLYQILLGSWPLEPLDATGLHAYCERIEAYMIKASREAKSRTSWADTSKDYEEALTQFVRGLLLPREDNVFLNDIKTSQGRIAWFGLLNSLSQTLCKLTAPGVPDIYQGNELWDFSLVDPDNRRPVDYERRQRMLAELQSAGEPTPQAARGLLNSIGDGRSKLYLTWKVLQFRRSHEALFRDGDYIPLRSTGEHAAHLCAFARRHAGEFAIVIAPRLYLHLLGEREEPPLGTNVWADTAIELPRGAEGQSALRNVLDGAEIPLAKAAGRSSLRAGDALAHFPVALAYTSLSGSPAPAG